MALLRCDFFSETLEVGTTMTVLLPQAGEEQVGVSGTPVEPPYPVLYLLHGLSDDSSAWLRYTSIERYAAAYGLAVVMPEVGRSFYADEAHGHRYWTFLSQELPDVVGAFFQVSDRREDTFVAGLSMGGYGAVKWALRHPERFAAAASLSGALDLDILASDEWRRPLFEQVFDGHVGPRDDLFALLDGADVTGLPRLFVGCGTEDHLLPSNRRFLAALESAGVEAHVDLRPGEHEWPVWDAMIQDVLAWLPRRPADR
jgi:S-formylglutathione hydrolase FrmB